jgi:hypothetical protein
VGELPALTGGNPDSWFSLCTLVASEDLFAVSQLIQGQLVSLSDGQCHAQFWRTQAGRCRTKKDKLEPSSSTGACKQAMSEIR